MSKLGKTNAEFELIEEGDKILVGLSGGKDSLTMIHAMKEQQRRAPFKFEFLAVIIESFIETPNEFKSQFPKVYFEIRQMLNFNFAGY